LKKLLSLFIAIYFLLYVFPFPFYLFGNLFGTIGGYYALSDGFTIWFGKTVLTLSKLERVEATGSGDTTLNYVGTVLNILLATVFSFSIWCFFKRKINSRKVFVIIGIYARCYLAYCCITYGFSKILVQQFPGLTYFRLAEPYGDSTPMGLFWTFMSGSKAYTIFCGLLEVLTGYLILFKRTRTIGGLLLVVVMIQIIMINLCYDVPVKLFSIHLLLMSLFVLDDDLKNLFKFLVLRQQVKLSDAPAFKNKKLFYGALAAQVLVLIGFSYFSVNEGQEYTESKWQEQFFGVYRVNSFEFIKDKSLKTAKIGWDEIIVDRRYNGDVAAKIIADGKRYRYTLNIDTLDRKMEFIGKESTDLNIKLQYKNQADTFYIEGQWHDQYLKAVLIRRDKTNYNLTNTGFHWIQEQPNNQ
jgi:hypothetical protein